MERWIPVGYLIVSTFVLFDLIRMVFNSTIYDHQYRGVLRSALTLFVGLIAVVSVGLVAFLGAAKWAFVLP
jgi:hypothetical protein